MMGVHTMDVDKPIHRTGGLNECVLCRNTPVYLTFWEDLDKLVVDFVCEDHWDEIIAETEKCGDNPLSWIRFRTSAYNTKRNNNQ